MACVFSRCYRDGGFNVSIEKVLEGEDSPDQDFFFASDAKFVVPSTGGYSKNIAAMVELLGSMVLEFPTTRYYAVDMNSK